MGTKNFKIQNYVLILTLILFLNGNIFSQWIKVSNGMGNQYVNALTAKSDYIFAGTSTYGVYYSKNGGTKWIQTSLNNYTVNALAINGSYIFAGTSTAGVLFSTDNGTSWVQSSLNDRQVNSLAVNGNYLYAGAGSSNGGVYVSSDNGSSWIPTSLTASIISVAANAGDLYAGYYNGFNYGTLYKSTDNGLNWTSFQLNGRAVKTLAFDGNYIYAGCIGGISPGVVVSSNNGSTWQQTLSGLPTFSLLINGTQIFAGTGGGAYISNDNGGHWTQINQGFTGSAYLRSLTIYSGYIFAGTYGKGVWRRLLSDFSSSAMIEFMNTDNENIPNEFTLKQNYPNPFNPSTNIEFNLPEKQYTKLTVYNILGREIVTLLNGVLEGGSYNAVFNSTNYPSGVYYYKINAGSFSETKKMILIK